MIAEVACMGEVLWDIFQHEDSDRFTRAVGGAIANVAVDLARVGIAARVVGGVGKDVFGDALAARLEAEGVDVSGLARLPERTGVAFITTGARGEPSFLFYRQATADMAITADHITKKIARARWVLVGTSTLMRPSLAEATWRFVSLAKEQGAGIVIDLNVREHLWSSKGEMREKTAALVRASDVVKGSTPDVEALGGMRFVEEHARHALVVITNGARPAIARYKDAMVSRPALKAKCVDATGGGDAFIAGVLASLVRTGAHPGSDVLERTDFLAEALDIGHTLGKMAVSSVGAVTGLTKLGPVKARLANLSKFSP